MEFIKNINGTFILKPEFNLLKNLLEGKVAYEVKQNIPKETFSEINVRITNIDLGGVTFSIVNPQVLEKLPEKITSTLIDNLKKNIEKTKKVANKVIDAWENNPKKFIKKEQSWGKIVYEYKKLLTDDEYHTGAFFFFDKISYHFELSFVTGCGSHTYYNKDYFVKALEKIDQWFEDTCKIVKTEKIQKRIFKYLSKIEISLSFPEVIKYISIPKEEIKLKEEKKPPFPIVLNGDELNSILSAFDGGIIDQEFIDIIKEEYDIDISSLLDWELSSTTEGYHHNDGDFCDYTVTFTSPNGHSYELYNSHCLVTGYTFSGKLIPE
jgi:hypothetical protein